MKRDSKVLFLLPAVMFLSACSLTGGGNDGGVFRSDDGGRNFSAKNAVENNRTINGVDVLSLSINPQDGNEIYMGSKASGIFKSTDGGELWKQLKVSLLTPTKIYSLAIDPTDPRNIFAVAVLGKRGKVVKSTDAGETWKDVYTEPSGGSLVLSLAIDPRNSQRIFAGTDQGQIIFSEDGGVTWRSVYWTKEKKPVYKIAYDNFDSDLIYFVLFQGGVLRTADGGNNFQELKQKATLAGLYESEENFQNPTAIRTDPSRADWVYIGTSEGLFRSKDRGENWEKVRTLNAPEKFSIRSIDINPKNSDELICAAAQTFYKSVDGGVNWLPVQADTSRTLEVVKYNLQNPEQIFIGLNKR